MTMLRFIQLCCDQCRMVMPSVPADKTAKAVRAEAAQVGWEVLRHTKGRDLCPPCRVKEINEAAGQKANGAQI